MGVDDGQYIIFRDLNKRVTKPSVHEVNKYSPIRVESEFKKQGRAVVAIRFLITKQVGQAAVDQVIHDSVARTVIDRLKEDYGFAIKPLENLFNKYDEAYLSEKMAMIESSSSYQNGKIEHLVKYLEKALEENYQPPKSSKENLEKLRIKQEQKAALIKLRENNMRVYRAYQNKVLPEVFAELPEKEKTAIEKTFDKYISSTLYHSVYIKDVLENPLVRDKFGDFIRSNHAELLASLTSFEMYCEQSLI